MATWNSFGSDRKEIFEREITPAALAETLKQYQRTFGKTFGINELLELEKIRAMALIAEAINDAPEFLIHHIGGARSESSFRSISGAIESVAEAISELKE